MPLPKLMDWSVTARKSRFPGRFLLGRLYKSLLYSILDPLFRTAYRVIIAVKERNLTAFTVSDYQLLKRVRRHVPAPCLARQWVQALAPHHHPSRYTDILSRLRTTKSRTTTSFWILPETALLAPALDCKGFAVLFSALLNAAGIRNELWIGLPPDGSCGHAWVVFETRKGRIAVDQFNGNGMEETLFLLNHPFAAVFQI